MPQNSLDDFALVAKTWIGLRPGTTEEQAHTETKPKVKGFDLLGSLKKRYQQVWIA